MTNYKCMRSQGQTRKAGGRQLEPEGGISYEWGGGGGGGGAGGRPPPRAYAGSGAASDNRIALLLFCDRKLVRPKPYQSDRARRPEIRKHACIWVPFTEMIII